MKIRKATIKDIEGIVKVFDEYEKDSVGYLPKKYKSIRDKRVPVNKNVRKALLEDITNKNGRYLVAEIDKIIVGYIYGYMGGKKHPLYAYENMGEFSDIAVLRKYRGIGISSKLWNELYKWFRSKKCKFITLSVNVNNSAQEIYKKWGFEVFNLRMIKKI